MEKKQRYPTAQKTISPSIYFTVPTKDHLKEFCTIRYLLFVKSVFSDSLSGFLKGHSCSSALIIKLEDFRASLDKKEDCVAVAIDLSKVFY